MTVIVQSAEATVLAAMADPATPPEIIAAINEQFNTFKQEKTRVRQAIQVAIDPRAPLNTRISAFVFLVDIMTGEQVPVVISDPGF